MRETTSRREAEGSSLMHPTPRDQEFLLLLEINHVVFVSLYLINILLINIVENVRNKVRLSCFDAILTSNFVLEI